MTMMLFSGSLLQHFLKHTEWQIKCKVTMVIVKVIIPVSPKWYFYMQAALKKN